MFLKNPNPCREKLLAKLVGIKRSGALPLLPGPGPGPVLAPSCGRIRRLTLLGMYGSSYQ